MPYLWNQLHKTLCTLYRLLLFKCNLKQVILFQKYLFPYQISSFHGRSRCRVHGMSTMIFIEYKLCVGKCGLADQCWLHKQKVVGSRPGMVDVCPWVRHFAIITHLDPGVELGTGNDGAVTGLLWKRCSDPHTTEKRVWPIRFEREMDAPTCFHRLKVYLTLYCF